ncbi:hypothetical protein [Streptomyces griseorubiginosus]|uniref:hypothetical protein n=1 Tax=Streptomyces griseorubiginosus TaxID=67304 RepID=UPI001AD68BB1|nr:hypothetical protein [Streptomyces griseorubiginosus]MBO4257499.1 hypothetical protein [Streptomyces griseorubiginosus]
MAAAALSPAVLFTFEEEPLRVLLLALSFAVPLPTSLRPPGSASIIPALFGVRSAATCARRCFSVIGLTGFSGLDFRATAPRATAPCVADTVPPWAAATGPADKKPPPNMAIRVARTTSGRALKKRLAVLFFRIRIFPRSDLFRLTPAKILSGVARTCQWAIECRLHVMEASA